MNVIEVKDLYKNFKNKELFNGLSLSVKQGSVHALLGPNGSGKTSLLRLLTGLYKKDSGEISLKSDFATLLEDDYLFEDMTGLENLRVYGDYFSYKLEGYEPYARLLKIDQDLLRKVSTYSKGMKRKLSLLIIVLMDRDIIFLDEVTSGVDPVSRVDIRKLIRLLKDKNKTILITSHDLAEIEKVGDYVTMIKAGHILFTSPMEELRGERLEEIFIREASYE